MRAALLVLCLGAAVAFLPRTPSLAKSRVTTRCGLSDLPEVTTGEEEERILPKSRIPPTIDDMKIFAALLANVTDHLDSQPEVAMQIASTQMGWMYSRNVPELTQMMLTEFPSIRQDDGMMRAYMFLMDFLEAVATESSAMLKKNQKFLRLILEASKQSEAAVDSQIESIIDEVKSPDFMVYLDSEIESQESNSPMENLLLTIKLRICSEIGRSMGIDVTRIPILAVIEDPAELKYRTVQHLESHDKKGVELFIFVLNLVRSEMKKRYTAVDPILFMNLGEIEKIAKGQLSTLSARENSE